MTEHETQAQNMRPGQQAYVPHLNRWLNIDVIAPIRNQYDTPLSATTAQKLRRPEQQMHVTVADPDQPLNRWFWGPNGTDTVRVREA